MFVLCSEDLNHYNFSILGLHGIEVMGAWKLNDTKILLTESIEYLGGFKNYSN